MARIHKTAVIYPNVEIDKDVVIGAYCVIGGPPEHKEYYKGQETKKVLIGRGARIFEFVTIHAGTTKHTLIGENSSVFNHSHIAHDCYVGRDAIIGGGCSLAGHTIVMAGATLSGRSCTHQRIVIGAFAMLAPLSFVKTHVPVGEIWMGIPARPSGINEIGLQRAGLTLEGCKHTFDFQMEMLIKEAAR